MKKSKKILLFIILILIIGGIFTFLYFFRNTPTKEEGNKIVCLDEIKGFEYKLEDRDTKLYKELFNELKKLLESDEYKDSEYAELISKMYIVDLYTISNKLSVYDVGSLEFIEPDHRDNFDLKVQETLYKYIEDNSNGNRIQQLPTVSEVETSNIEETKLKLDETEYNGYTLDIKWSYEEDLGYDTKATISLIKKDKIMYVIEQK